MIESLRTALINLRDALRAAGRSASELRAPLPLRLPLERSARLLDAVLSEAGALGPRTTLLLANWSHTALAQAGVALAAWFAWTEQGLPAEA